MGDGRKKRDNNTKRRREEGDDGGRCESELMGGNGCLQQQKIETEPGVEKEWTR
jgi:hypothetical protein